MKIREIKYNIYPVIHESYGLKKIRIKQTTSQKGEESKNQIADLRI